VSSTSRRVVVTGLGVLSSLADSPGALHEALCAGSSALKPVEMFDTAGLDCRHAGELRDFDAKAYLQGKLRPLDRTSRIAAVATKLALDDSGWTEERRRQQEVGLVLGTMYGSVHTISTFDRRAQTSGPGLAKPMQFANSVLNAAAGQTAIRHDLRGVNSTVSGGTTSGLKALAYAADLIRSGRADVLVAGGADELCFESFHGFHQAGLLCGTEAGEPAFPIPFDARRNGFVPGEGAALLVLEDAESACTRGATPLAEIRGYAYCHDRSGGREAAGAERAVTRAVQLALEATGARPDSVDCLSSSANGSRERDRCEARGLAAALNGSSSSIPVLAVNSMLGETLGASGAFQTVAVLQSMRSGLLPGVRGLTEIDTDLGLGGLTDETREGQVDRGLVVSQGLGGGAIALVTDRWDSH